MNLEPFVVTEHWPEGPHTELSEAVERRIERGFYEAVPHGDAARWRARIRQEMGMRTIGFLDTDPQPLGQEGPNPVATLAAWDGAVCVGDESLGSRLVSGVGVAPTHRRRGLLRRMMSQELGEAQARGLPLASLTVSEGEIYGRFGFGMCTRWATYSLQMKPQPQFRPGVLQRTGAEEGTLHEVDPKALLEVSENLHEQVARTRAGQVHRFPGMAEHLLGVVNMAENSTEPDRARQAVLYQGPEGPEGYAVFKHRGWTGQEASVLEVKDFQAVTPRAEVGLWNHLMSLDLVDRIEFRGVPGGELRQLLTNPRALRVLSEKDIIWNRILDVPAVLRARTYRAEGEVVLAVQDRMGLVEGLYHLAVSGGAGQVLGQSTVEDADFAPGVPRAEFTADVLASAVFRGCEPEARLGAIGGEGAALAALLLGVAREPYCDIEF